MDSKNYGAISQESAAQALSAAPILIGSEKQIAWAQNIRIEQVGALFGHAINCPAAVTKFSADCGNGKSYLTVLIAAATEVVTSEPNAKKWIDERSTAWFKQAVGIKAQTMRQSVGG